MPVGLLPPSLKAALPPHPPPLLQLLTSASWVSLPARSDEPHEAAPRSQQHTSGSQRAPPPLAQAPPVLTTVLPTPDRPLLPSGPRPLGLPNGPLALAPAPPEAPDGRRRPSAPAQPAPGALLTVLSGAWPWEEGARNQQQRKGQAAGQRRARHPTGRRATSEWAGAGKGGEGGRGRASARGSERGRQLGLSSVLRRPPPTAAAPKPRETCAPGGGRLRSDGLKAREKRRPQLMLPPLGRRVPAPAEADWPSSR